MAEKTAKKSVIKTGTRKAVAKTSAGPAAKALGENPAKAKPQRRPRPATAAPELAVGQRAPAFTLPRDGGDTLALADYAGRKLVIFFYPRADTPGCTREAMDFSRLAATFAAAGTAVLGVSADPPKKQEAFRDKHGLTVPLASDAAHAILERYGAWGQKTLYGKSFKGIIRTTVLIGGDGRIARVWRNVKVEGHAEEVLAAARELS